MAQAQQQSTTGVMEQFQADLIATWPRLPNKLFFLLLLAAWMSLFLFLGNSTFGYVETPSLLRWMHKAYTSGDSPDAHGLIVPFVVLGLFWWKRGQLLAAPPRVWWPGLGFVVVGLFLHVIGYTVQQPRISIVAMFTGVYGLMGVAWGREWLRKSAFPFFLFIFCVPLGTLSEPITFRLRLLVCWLVEMVSHFLNIDVLRAGTQLMDPTGSYNYDVAPACSGIRSLVTTFLLATVYGFVVFASTWKRLLLMALAFPFAVLGNLLRMLLIIIFAAIGGRAAGDWVHENTLMSLIPYIPAIVGLLIVGQRLESPASGDAQLPGGESAPPSGDAAMPAPGETAGV